MRPILKRFAFSLWLLAAVLLAVIFPGPGSNGGILFPEITTQLGVWLIFFLQGLGLPTGELAAGYRPKRLHGFVLSWNFLWFPGLVGLLTWPLSLVLERDILLGFWLLAIMPTTISSAVVFATASGGHAPNAVFSTVFSNLLAVFLVPAVAVAYLAAGTELPVSLLPLLRTLALLIFLPLLLGQFVRRFLPSRSAAVAAKAKPVSNWIILFIVHCAFAGSASSGFLEGLSVGAVFAVIGCTLGLLLLVSGLVWCSSAWLHVAWPSRISGYFCASQKSLAIGLPLATSIFASVPGLVDVAAVLIPLMVYHPAQLVLAGVLSGRWARRSNQYE